MSPFLSRAWRAVRALAAGALAGLVALGLDQLLALLTLGFMVPVALRHAAAYAALGAAAGLALVLAALSRRRVPSVWTTFAVAAAGVYASAIFERVYHVLGHRLPSVLAVAAALSALAAYGMWIAVMARIAGGRVAGGRVSGDWRVAPLLGAVGAAVALAVNRNLVDLPLEPAALAADAAVLAAALGLAWLARAAGGRRILAALVALAVAGAGMATLGRRTASPPPAAAGEGPPNLVLVILDTLRQDTFRSVLRQTEEGRAFRRAMAGSAWFHRAIAASPWTVPSVGSIMTGLYPQEHGFNVAPAQDPGRPLRPLAESVTTLAQRLQRLGYRTEAIGTNPLLQPVSGIARGFEHYEILSGPTVKLPPLTALARLDLLRDDNYQQAASVRRRLRQRLPELTAGGQPVFLWLHLMDPHSPLKSHRGLSPDPTAEGLDEMRRLYRGEVRYSLRELTSMLELLRDYGLWQNTALVVVSDHGEMFPDDNHDTGVKTLDGTRLKLYGHGHAMYAELVNVPLVIRPPGGLPESRRVSALTSHVDLFDTVLDLLGVGGGRPGGDRVSLAPWLAAEPPEPERRGRPHVLIGANQHGPKQRAFKTRRFKLIDYTRSDRLSELYEIVTDAREQRDLASVREADLARLERKLESVWAELSAAPAADPTELDAETLERLRALGYVP